MPLRGVDWNGSALSGSRLGRNYAGARTLASATADPEEWGRCVESAVGAHLLSQSFAKGFDVLYWRDGGLEVDYVLRRGERLVAIEVKTNAESSTDGLAEFRRRFHPVSSLVVGPSGMPLSEFLSVNPADLLR